MFGSIVLSAAGRDKGNIFVVSKIEGNYVYLVDGDIHKVENPKYKKVKHVTETQQFSEFLGEKFKNNNKVSNQDVKRILQEVIDGVLSS